MAVNSIQDQKEIPAPRRRISPFRLGVAILVVGICIPLVQYSRDYFRKRANADFHAKCKDLATDKNWEELTRIAEQWSILEPQSADPWLYRSEAAEGQGQWEQVVKFLDRVPRSDRRAIRSLVSKSVFEFERLNRPWDGVRTCDEILELDPRVMIAHKQSIFFYMMTLQREEAIRRVRRAIRVRRESPESYIFLVGGNWLYPGSLYRTNSRWLESDPESELFQVARAMQIYTTDAKSDRAQAELYSDVPEPEQLLEKFPHNRELLSHFLNSAMAEGNLERAQEMLNAFPAEFIEVDPRYWRAKAWCEDTLGELDEAEKSLQKAYSLAPYWWHVHYKLADLLRRKGNLDESAFFMKVYKLAKELSTEITDLNSSPENLDEKKFCKSLLELSTLIGDDQVVEVLRERVANN